MPKRIGAPIQHGKGRAEFILPFQHGQGSHVCYGRQRDVEYEDLSVREPSFEKIKVSSSTKKMAATNSNSEGVEGREDDDVFERYFDDYEIDDLPNRRRVSDHSRIFRLRQAQRTKVDVYMALDADKYLYSISCIRL
jgi:hypothetical protein